jgi:phage terminase small subunit
LQARFVREYLKDLHGAEAVRRAGYQTKYPDRIAYQLLENSRVAAAINDAKLKRAKRTEISADRVLQESARLAFLDIRQLYNEDGSLKPISQWPDDVAAAVAGIDSIEQYDWVDGEKVPAGVLKKIRLWSKPGQLDLLAKHLKLLREEKAETVVNVTVVVQSLSGALARAYGNDGQPNRLPS